MTPNKTFIQNMKVFSWIKIYMFFDFRNLIKYLLEGLAVALAAYYIPRKTVSIQEIAMIALTAAATFAVLDRFSPLVAAGARHGSGFGIGMGLSLEGFQDSDESDIDKLLAECDQIADDTPEEAEAEQAELAQAEHEAEAEASTEHEAAAETVEGFSGFTRF